MSGDSDVDGIVGTAIGGGPGCGASRFPISDGTGVAVGTCGRSGLTGVLRICGVASMLVISVIGVMGRRES